MVAHMVMWQLKEDDKERTKAAMKKRLEELCGQIDGLVSSRVGNPYQTNGYDICLYSVFENREALAAYTVHPKHVAIVNEVGKPNIIAKAFCDYVF